MKHDDYVAIELWHGLPSYILLHASTEEAPAEEDEESKRKMKTRDKKNVSYVSVSISNLLLLDYFVLCLCF